MANADHRLPDADNQPPTAPLMEKGVPQVEFIDGENGVKTGKGVSKFDVKEPPPKFIGLTKEELAQYENDPFWRRLRLALFILFWVAWIAMFAIAIAIVIISPKCPEKPKREWWQKKVCEQIFVRSFKDSNSDGIGDLHGLMKELPSMIRIGVSTIWPIGIVKSKDFFSHHVESADGFREIQPELGAMHDFDHLLQQIDRHNMFFIMDFIGHVTSKTHEWFLAASQKSASEDDRNRYFFVNAKQADIDAFDQKFSQVRSGESLWYLHLPGDPEAPILNLKHPSVMEVMKENMKFWLQKGVDGFYIKSKLMAVDEKYKQDWSQTETFLREFRALADAHQNLTDSNDILLFTSIEAVGQDRLKIIDRLVKRGGLNLVIDNTFSKLTVDMVNSREKLGEFRDKLDQMLEFHSTMTNETWSKNDTWPLWDLGSPTGNRLANRMRISENDETNAAANAELVTMLFLLLPGSVNNLYGDEIGMKDVPKKEFNKINIVEDVDEKEKFKSLTPMQWNDERNAGFSDVDHELKIPVNEDYLTNNFNKLYNEQISPLRLFRRLANIRQLDDFVYGNFSFGSVTEATRNVLSLIIRNSGGFTFVAALNFDQDTARKNVTSVDLRMPFGGHLGPCQHDSVGVCMADDHKGSVVAMTSNLARRGVYQARQIRELNNVELEPLEGIVFKFKV